MLVSCVFAWVKPLRCFVFFYFTSTMKSHSWVTQFTFCFVFFEFIFVFVSALIFLAKIPSNECDVKWKKKRECNHSWNHWSLQRECQAQGCQRNVMIFCSPFCIVLKLIQQSLPSWTQTGIINNNPYGKNVGARNLVQMMIIRHKWQPNIFC